MFDNKIDIEKIPCAIIAFIYDKDFTFSYANNAFYNLTKYTKEDFKRNSSLKRIFADESISLIEKKVLNTTSDYFDVELKLKNKDGKFIYTAFQIQINYENNDIVFLCTVTNINIYADKIKKIKMREERFRKAADISCEIVFEVDFEKNSAILSKDFRDNAIKEIEINSFDKAIMNSNIIHNEDRIYLYEYYDCAKDGINGSDIEFRMLNLETQEYEWFNLSYVVIFDENSFPIKAVGIFKNINKQKEEKTQLIEKSQIDGLTKLYNKTMTETEIKKYLEYNINLKEVDALIVIDIDSFKSINDNYGHLLGDAVLVDVACAIKKVFRETDIIGRIGGDEFVVFMKSVPSEELVCRKVTMLCAKIADIYTEEFSQQTVTISAGIALTSNERISYKKLFKNADIALYNAKKSGKNGFSIYSSKDEVSLNNKSVNFNLPVKKTQNMKSIETTVLDVIKESNDINSAMFEVLAIIGTRMDVSRVFFIKYDFKNKKIIRDFTWSSSDKYNFYYDIQFIDNKEIRSEYLSCFVDGQTLYCSDTSSLKEILFEYFSLFNVKATLQCACFEDNQIRGILGLYDCEQKRLWLQDEVNSLSFLVDILSEFTYNRTINSSAAGVRKYGFEKKTSTGDNKLF